MMIRLTYPTRTARPGGRSFAAAALLVLGTWAAPAVSEDIEEEIDGRYTYIRALDGDAELINSDGEEESEAITNYPVLTGDRLETDDDTFVDVILSDGTQLTLGEDAELLFENLSGSPDGLSDDEGTLLQLLEGEALLRVGLVRTSAFYPVIDTANTRIYLQEDGVYRIVANDHDFTEVSVLEGSVEVLTQTDDVRLTSGEAASFDGYADPYVVRLRADWDEEIVHWSDNIERRYSRGTSSALDAPLSGTAHLDSSGDWVTVDTGRAWRPRVEASWRPYHRGRWTHTPSGLYWVSYDPWLPVTYRYGLWDLHPTHGWLWHPGYRYRTAHVYWYWGTDYAGWIPSGYYNRYYRHRYAGFGFRAGVLGWAGSRWDPFYDWTFCPTRYIGYRKSYRYYEPGRRLHDRGVRLGRGIIATSTRGLGRDDWKRPALVSAALERGWRRDDRNRDLPDVTRLVSRGELTPEVRDTFVVERTRRSATVGGSRVVTNRSGRVATSIRDEATVARSSRGAASTRSRDVAGDGRVVRRSASPGRVPSATSGSSSGSSEAVRRSSTPTRSRDRGTTSARGATPRDGATSVSRSSSPARRVIDGAGSRGSSTRSSSPARRPPTAGSSSGSRSSSRARESTPPPRSRASSPPSGRSSSASSSRGRSSTRSSSPPPSTRRSTPPPRSRASSPPSGRSSSASSSRGRSSTRSSSPPPSARRSTPPPRSRASSPPSGRSSSASSSRGRSSTRSSSPPPSARRSTPPPRSRASSPPVRRSSSASSARSSATRRPSSASSAPKARASSSSSSRRSSATSSRSSSRSRASAAPSRSSNRSSARSSSSGASSSRSKAARSSSRRTPPR